MRYLNLINLMIRIFTRPDEHIYAKTIITRYILSILLNIHRDTKNNDMHQNNVSEIEKFRYKK